MSGLAAEIVAGGSGRADLGAVNRMVDALPSRVPGETQTWEGGWAVLGRSRLRRPGEGALEPLIDQTGSVAVVIDGRLHNAAELRRDLGRRGHRFGTESDSEVVLAAYERWGEGLVDHLRGSFAFVLVDLSRRTTLLARDRLGTRPLYLSVGGRRLRIASTLPALLAAGKVDTTLDPVAIHHYLSWHSIVPAPRTVLGGVRKLPAATVRVVDASGGVRDRVYWRPDYTRSPDHADWDDREWMRAVKDALGVAITRQLSHGEPTGVLLSGGLDSSLLVALLVEHSPVQPVTYSIGFDAAGDVAGDEFFYSNAVARTFGTDHHRLRIPTEELVPAALDAVADMTEPMGTHDATAFHLLSRTLSGTDTVLLSGQGADEVFAGYDYHLAARGLPRERVLSVLDEAFRDYTHDALRNLVAPGRVPDHDVSRDLLAANLDRDGAETALDALLRLDTHLLMVDDPLKRVDSMARAWGISIRLPFLDEDVVELAAACPPELKLSDDGKGPLKQLGAQLLPICVVNRAKGYFPLPGLVHLDGAVRDLVADTLRSDAARSRGLLRADAVDRMLADPNANLAPTGGNRLWQLAVLELWLQHHGV